MKGQKKILLVLGNKGQLLLCNQQNRFFKSQTKVKTEDYILETVLTMVFYTHKRSHEGSNKAGPAKDPRHTIYNTDCLNLENSGYIT